MLQEDVDAAQTHPSVPLTPPRLLPLLQATHAGRERREKERERARERESERERERLESRRSITISAGGSSWTAALWFKSVALRDVFQVIML